MGVDRGPELRAVRHGLVGAAGALVLLLAPGSRPHGDVLLSALAPSGLLGLLAAGAALVPRGPSAWRAGLLVGAAALVGFVVALAGTLQLEASGPAVAGG